MRRRLGLDIGTNSIGWALVDEESGRVNIASTQNTKAFGSVIFTEGVKLDSGNEISRAAERTAKRSARKLNFRRKLRKYETLKVLIANGMCPLSIAELEKWRQYQEVEGGVKGPVLTFHHYPKNEQFLEWLRTDEKTDKNPYFLRFLFSTRKMDWEKDSSVAHSLGRAFYHLSQRRGFKSNRLDQTDDDRIDAIKEDINDLTAEADNAANLYTALRFRYEDLEFDTKKSKDLDETDKKLKRLLDRCMKIAENRNGQFKSVDEIRKAIDEYLHKKENLGVVKGDIRDLSEAIEEGGFETLGQYFWSLYQKERTDIKHKIRKRYTGREEHYQREFDVICETQQLPQDLRDKLHKAIFYQRPLRSQKGTIAKCTLEPRKPRCPISRPEFEEFRMLSLLNNIQVKEPGNDTFRGLTTDERDRAIGRFYLQRTSFKLNELCNAINKNGTFYYSKDPNKTSVDWEINYPLNTTVSGSPVSAAIKLCIGENWSTRTFTYTTLTKDGSSKEHRVDYQDIWHALFTFDDRDKLEAYFIENLGLSVKEARKLSRVIPQQGYAQLSLKAINAILPWLRDGYIYTHAVFLAKLPEIIKPSVWSDDNQRENVVDAIQEITDTHSDELTITHVVNTVLKQFFTEKNYAREYSNDEFKNMLTDAFQKRMGKRSWNATENKDQLLLKALKQFSNALISHAGENDFSPIQAPTIKERIRTYLADNNLLAHPEAGASLYHPSDLEGFKAQPGKDIHGNTISILPSPMSDSIKNPVLIRTMHQLRKVLNHLLIQGEINADTQINIELAREVNDANMRAAIKKWQDRLRDEREDAHNEIVRYFQEEHGQNINPDETDIDRYILWEQQDRREIYEDNPKNIPLTDIIGSESRYDIEHTIPRSVSWDNSMANKTLCTKRFNREIKRNQIPSSLPNHDNILDRLVGWEKRVLDLKTQIAGLKTTGLSDKAKKDQIIQKRHLLRFEHDFWKNKYERFTKKEIKEGFKNSQLTDTGLITRYARNWLGAVFQDERGRSNVRVVNGRAVSEFRKAWGLQALDERKSRANHAHHCIDAITIACITKRLYDQFAHEWRKEEDDYLKHNVIQKARLTKPWPTFTEDVKRIEHELLVVHQTEDNAIKHTRKKVRRRGRIIRNPATGNPLYQDGDTARVALHKDSYYGSILHPKTGEQTFVIRRQIDTISATDIEKIIDPVIREIVKKGKKREEQLIKHIKLLKNQLSSAQTEEAEAEIKADISATVKELSELFVLPSRNGKLIPIRKVRIEAKIKEPLPDFKKQRDVRRLPDGTPKYPHKTEVYVANDSNYGLAIYEDLERDRRVAVSINMMEAITSAKRSNASSSGFIESSYRGMPLKGVLRIGTMVLFYENEPDEIWDLPDVELRKRLYYVKKTGKDGRATFQFNQEARNDIQLKVDYESLHGEKAPDKITSGYGQLEINNIPISKFRLSPGNMRMLIQGIDFDLTATGEIVRLS